MSDLPSQLIQLFWSKVRKEDPEDCWEWTGAKSPRGYGVFGWAYKLGYEQRAHRFSWILHHEMIPPGLFICHKCDNPGCVNPNHLFIGTTQQNTQDREYKLRGNAPKGSGNGLSKLTEELVEKIRKDPRSSRNIAKDLKVSHMTVLRAKNGKTWRHV